MSKVGALGIAALLLLAVSGASGAEAASFDCGKAGSVSEKAICADPALSVADERMAAAFRAALGRLSQRGQEAITKDQRAWLGYREKLCATRGSTLGDPEKDPAQCVADEIMSRTALLGQEGQRLGPYVLMSLGTYALRRYKPDPDANWDTGLNVETVRWPRIDGPENDRTARWNRWIEDKLRPKNEDAIADDNVSQIKVYFRLGKDVTLPADNLISVVIGSAGFAGGAHGNELLTTYTYRLDEERELKPADLFNLEKPWVETLRQQSAALLKIQLPDTFTQPNDKDFDQLVSDVRAWTLGAQGLSIRFEEYSVGPYSDGIPEIVIPWRQLDEVLSPRSVMSNR